MKIPARIAAPMPHAMPIQMGWASSAAVETLVTPKPAMITQHTPPARLITEPTEISVPAEQETTRVIPSARMATSLPRFRMSTIRP